MPSFTVEFRVDVESDNADKAAEEVRRELTNGGGRLTAIFDEDWNEV